MELIRVNEELRLQLAHRFAKHSEKYYPNQPDLFDELEENVIPEDDTAKVNDEQIYKEEIVESYNLLEFLNGTGFSALLKFRVKTLKRHRVNLMIL